MEGPERLQKLIARAGVASRRKAEELIEAGRVTVNGRVARLGDRAGSGDDVRLDGRPVAGPDEHVTYVLHKPRGYVTTVSDDRGRPTVMQLVPSHPGLHPAGRLDMDSEGLLVLTTDGELTLALTHPRYGHEKEYRVYTRPPQVAEADLARLTSGVALEDGQATAVAARASPGGAVLVLREGRKRQVRRMLAAVGYEVDRLVRTRIGAFGLGDLEPGRYRRLRSDELASLTTDPPLV